ncbi:S1C family serine protease [Capillimicrobium parvum]|uniref:Serine protease HtrA n=1 Tax=Capillimicrobium parvum TaxID=2884022 RepID=A0A9E7C1K4_9ACTN|nr:trypsin-like peptidase domain-containing protein [Capillimicrobium parvum]UGS37486.1 Putative serine protease HtrA [Capillimicrobium parvum]
MRKAAIPVLAGLLGGAVAVAVAVLLGVGGTDHTTTTVIEQAALQDSPSTRSANAGERLTARDIYKRDAPGVVFVRAQVVAQSQSPFGFGQPQQGEATGSGFVIDSAGDILTNAHVVDGAVKITVQFDNDKTVDARVVGKDTDNDIALLRVEPDGIDLHPLRLGSAKSVQVGDPVLAIGNPYGLDRTLTTGVISALQRQIQAPNGFAIRDVLQTDAAINPGNSGGPLLDAAGRVIGINSQIATGGSGGGNVGIGFAVPIDTAEQVLPALKRGEPVKRAYLGISTRTIDGSLDGAGLPVRQGALIQTVERGSSADKAGLKAGAISAQLATGESVQLGGDIITQIDGRRIVTSDDVAAIVSSKKPGDRIKVTFLRGGRKMSAEITLGNRPSAQQSG